MPPIDLNTFHSAIQNLRGNDTVVVLGQDKHTGDSVLSGLKPSKSGNVDGLEMRQAFFSALVQSGSSEEYLKATYKKLGLDDQSKAHAPLTVKDIKAHLDERSEMGLKQFKVSNPGDRPVDEEWMQGDFVVIGGAGSMAERKPIDDFVIVEKNADVPKPANLLDRNDADQIRNADLQQRRDMLCTTLKGLCKVTDAQLQRLDVQGLKELIGWLKEEPIFANDPKKVARMVDFLSVSAHKVNQDELLTSVKRLETDPAFADKVKIEDGAKAKSKATRLQSLLSDLVLDADTVLHDTLSTEARMLATLEKHKEAIAYLLKTDLKTCLENLPPLMASMAKQVKEKLTEFFGCREEDLAKSVKNEGQPDKADVKPVGQAEKQDQAHSFFSSLCGAFNGLKVRSSNEITKRINDKLVELRARLDKNEAAPELQDLDDKIGELVVDRCDKLQSVMAEVFEGVVAGKDVDMTALLDQIDPESVEIINQYYPDILPEGAGQSNKAKGEQQPQLRDEGPEYAKSAEEVEGYARNEKYLAWEGKTDAEQMEIIHGMSQAQDRRDLIFSTLANNFKNDEVLHCVIERWKTHDIEATLWLQATPLTKENILDYANTIAKDLRLRLTVEKRVVKPKQEDPLAKLRATSLDDIASKGALDPDHGYGKFVLDAMKTYFKSVDPIDRRAMYASMIRNSPICIEVQLSMNHVEEQPQNGKFDVNVDFSKKIKDNQEVDGITTIAATTIGAFFKGAGPVMQKTLQQLSSMEIPKALKLALVDMRSNLLPMPDKMVQAMLAKMVEDSHGEIKQITAKEIKGAASVAESILCEIEDKNGVKREAVVKLVRPDAAYRADREKQVFLDAAGDDEGMRTTFQGRLLRIMEEFDLEIETANAELGKVYDKESTLHDRNWDSTGSIMQSEKFADVQAVKIDKASPPGSHTAMIMEKASGKTLDRTIEYFTNAIKASQRKWNQLRSSKNLDTPENIDKFIIANHKKLLELHDQMVAVKQKALHFSHQWVNEAIYGSGFFHGDAHAGNLMLDEQKLTAIDFGNATLLTPHEQKMVLRVIMACRSENSEKFLTSFRELLSPEGRRQFDAKREVVAEHIGILMQKKADGGDSKIGTLIAATIVELQKLEIEIPAPIFNFSYSQIMLQTTIEELDTKIAELRDHLTIIANANDPTKKSAELQHATELLANYQVDKDSAVHAQISKFLLDDALKLEFSAFERQMNDLLYVNGKYPGLLGPYNNFVMSQGYQQCSRFADARDKLAVLNRICKYGYDAMTEGELTAELRRIQNERNRLEAERAANAGNPELSDSQKSRRNKALKTEIDRFAQRELDIGALKGMVRPNAGTYANWVKARRTELQTAVDNFKRGGGKAAFTEARKNFSEFFTQMRKTVIKETKRELEGQKNHLDKMTEHHRQLQAIKPKTKSEIAKDERTFLTVMASSILDHKFKAICSMIG